MEKKKNSDNYYEVNLFLKFLVFLCIGNGKLGFSK